MPRFVATVARTLDWPSAPIADVEVAYLLARGRARVADAFGHASAPFFSAQAAPGAPLCLILPHPSGRCRIWNEDGAVGRARALILSALPTLEIGEADEDAP